MEVYDIANNQITNAAFIGTVGLGLADLGVGNFSGMPGETDLMLRNINTGGLEVYDIANNQITGAAFLGTVGLGLAVRGHRPDSRAPARPIWCCATSTPARSRSTTSPTINSPEPPAWVQVGLDWQLGGFAADPPTGAMGSSDAQTAQLVQAMAGFGGGSGAAMLECRPASVPTRHSSRC